MKFRNKLREIVAGTLLLTGCAHFNLAKDYVKPLPRPSELVQEFKVDYDKIEEQRGSVTNREKYSFSDIRLSFIKDNETNNVSVIEFRPRVKDKSGAILVYPTNGGSYFIEKSVASYFASRGLVADIIERPAGKRELKFGEIDYVLRRPVKDGMAVISWLETLPYVDKKNIGTFGASAGGISDASLVALDDRIKAACVAIAAGDLPNILTITPELEKPRNKILHDCNINIGEFHRKLKNEIKCDPANYAPYVDAKKVYFIAALLDKIVDSSEQIKLIKSMHNPENDAYLLGHYPMAIALPLTEPRAYSFFYRRFHEGEKSFVKLDNPPYPTRIMSFSSPIEKILIGSSTNNIPSNLNEPRLSPLDNSDSKSFKIVARKNVQRTFFAIK